MSWPVFSDIHVCSFKIEYIFNDSAGAEKHAPLCPIMNTKCESDHFHCYSVKVI